jgi:hypothetical protein
LRQISVANAHFREILKADSNPVRVAIVEASGGFTRRIALDSVNTRVPGYCVFCLFTAGTTLTRDSDGAAEDYPLARGKRYLNVGLLNAEYSMVISGAAVIAKYSGIPRKSPENDMRARSVGMLESMN